MMRTGVALVAVLAVAAPAHAGRGGALVKYLADDTTFVVVADIAHARGTPIFTKAIAATRAKYAWWDSSGVAFDQLIDTVVVGGAGPLLASSDQHHLVIVVEGKLDKLVAAVKKASAKSTAYGGVTVWTIDAGDAAVIDKRLVLAATGDLRNVIDRARGKTKAKGAQAMREILAATTAGTDVFGGISIDESWRTQLGQLIGGEPRWAAFSLAGASKLVMDLRLEFADDAAAAKVAPALAAKIADPALHEEADRAGVKDFSDSLVVDQDRELVRISATMTAEEVDHLLTILAVTM